jgi:hypothetical protein
MLGGLADFLKDLNSPLWWLRALPLNLLLLATFTGAWGLFTDEGKSTWRRIVPGVLLVTFSFLLAGPCCATGITFWLPGWREDWYSGMLRSALLGRVLDFVRPFKWVGTTFLVEGLWWYRTPARLILPCGAVVCLVVTARALGVFPADFATRKQVRVKPVIKR